MSSVYERYINKVIIIIIIPAVHIISSSASFSSFHGLMNSINWPVSRVWVFIAQLGEHCSANAEATGSNPVEAPKKFFHFFGLFCDCLNCDLLRWSHIHFICIPAVYIISFCIIIVPFFRTGVQGILLSLCLHKSYLEGPSHWKGR